MAAATRDSSFFSSLQSKNVIITGGSNGIGAETVRLFHAHGANVVIADLPYSQSTAEALIASLSSRVIFIPTDILNWASMISLFKQAKEKFRSIEVVVANAGMMESKPYFDFEEDENGDLKEPTESYKIIDVNLKGTMNTVRLALYHMRSNKPAFSDGSRGSIVLISSTSGYFGGTGVASYVSSKHGVTGILRASQLAANEAGVRVNGVAPFFTPTHIVSSFSQVWADSGLPANSVHDVASAIAQVATDNNYKGACLLVFGSVFKEIENSRTELLPFWMGTDVTDLMRSARALFDHLGSYPLPKPRT